MTLDASGCTVSANKRFRYLLSLIGGPMQARFSANSVLCMASNIYFSGKSYKNELECCLYWSRIVLDDIRCK
jgi:hypothetical protein